MPGVPDKKQQQLLPVETTTPAGDAVPQQPRQPQNLQGLLRFAMEAHGSANPQGQNQQAQQPQALDEESKTFLQEALKSMTVDVIALMKENIETLVNVSDIDEDEVPVKLEAFESILHYVDNMDIANDFHKINGFAIFEPCLACKHAEIRAQVCDLIAELAQNNPYIQNVICGCTSVLPKLLLVLQNDESTDVKIKALYAISCITRESAVGYATFKRSNGLEAMKASLGDSNEKLQTKAAFLLCALHPLDENIIDEMYAMNFLPIILSSLNTEHKNSHEHLLSLLVLMADKSNKVKEDLKSAEVNGTTVGDILKKNLQYIHGKEEFKEEQEYCEKLLRWVQIN